MAGEQGGRGFAVGAGNGHDAALARMPIAELDLADHRDALRPDGLHDRRFFGDTGAFDDFSGSQNFVHRVLPALVLDTSGFQFGLIRRFDGTFVRYKNVIAQPFGQERGACTGFAGAEDDYAFVVCHCYYILPTPHLVFSPSTNAQDFLSDFQGNDGQHGQ